MNNEVRHTSQGASMNHEPPLFPSVHVDLGIEWQLAVRGTINLFK